MGHGAVPRANADTLAGVDVIEVATQAGSR